MSPRQYAGMHVRAPRLVGASSDSVRSGRRAELKAREIRKLCSTSAIQEVLCQIAQGTLSPIGLDQNGAELYIVTLGLEAEQSRVLISFRIVMRAKVVTLGENASFYGMSMALRRRAKNRRHKTEKFALVRVKGQSDLATAEEWLKYKKDSDHVLSGDLHTIKMIEMKMPTPSSRQWSQVG